MTVPPRTPARPDVPCRWQDAAFVIPVFAALLIMPLLLNLFAIRRMLFGLPLEVAYLFTIWVALVAGAMLLSRHLPHQHDPPAEAEGTYPEEN